MALNLQNKQQIVAEVKEASEHALSAVVADSRGITVEKMTDLRKSAREAGVSLRVVRNTLLRRALADTAFSSLESVLTGPSLLAFSNEHPGAAARIFDAFAKDNKDFEIKGAVFDGNFIPASDIAVLATLPTYEEAIARLMGTIKEAAAGKLARTFAAYREKIEAEA